ncbi:hypothetical protein J3F83DRAFT_726580 [Trichoderma novae-zelandiae]
MSAPRLVMSLMPCNCASNSRVHASGKSRRRRSRSRSKQPTASHQSTSSLVHSLCLKGLRCWSRGSRSTRYINDKHACCVYPYHHSSFIQRSSIKNNTRNHLADSFFLRSRAFTKHPFSLPVYISFTDINLELPLFSPAHRIQGQSSVCTNHPHAGPNLQQTSTDKYAHS